MTTLLIARAAEETSGGWNHWVVGGIAFGILLFLLFALIAFGNGREHS
ncbi:hypothetical protein GCM10022215_11880 [Nocardioides fonticola]|uniref:Uncharacterized protein n=1 Tax=Nocardioides fonticola TaxID=450363 RepID=A0ABP7XFK1_9ACTN